MCVNLWMNVCISCNIVGLCMALMLALLTLTASLDGNSARRDFLTYALSLMRSHNDEHSDNLPIIDISALKHVAYVFDALIYYMRSGTDSDADLIRDGISVHSWQDHDENENEDGEDDTAGGQNVTMETDSMDGESDVGLKAGRKHPFFQRSDSTTFLGCPPPDPFTGRLAETLPLADQPQLLQPNARREDLFGMPRQTISVPASDPETPVTAAPGNSFDRLPTHLALSTRTVDTPYAHGAALPTFPSASAVEVPSCSSSATPAPAPPATTSTESASTTTTSAASTSVIVKSMTVALQQAARLFQPLDGSPQTVPMNLSSDLALAAEAPPPPPPPPPAATAPTPPATPVVDVPPTTTPVVTQPSVIVHAGSALPMVLPSTGGTVNKPPPAEDEAKEPKPSTSAASGEGTSSTTTPDQPSTSTADT